MNNNENNNINSNMNNSIQQLNNQIRNSDNLNNNIGNIDQLAIFNQGTSNAQQSNITEPNPITPQPTEQGPSMVTPTLQPEVSQVFQNLEQSSGVQPVQNVSIQSQANQPVQNIQNANTSTSNVSVQPNTSLNNSTQVNADQSLQDDELLKAYIGKNYDKITKKSFNFAGFFLTTLYLFYRKMFGYGILIFLCQMILLCIPIIGLFTPIAVCILLGIFSNKIYLSKANKDINKIKIANPNLSQEELKNICSKKGGTSIGLSILGSIVNFIIAVIFVLIIVLIFGSTMLATLFYIFNTNIDLAPHISTSDYEQTKSNYEELQEELQGEYDGIMYTDNNIDITKEYSIVIPSIFNENESIFESKYQYDYSFDSDTGIFNSCKINMSKILGYTSAEKLAQELYNYNVNDSESVLSNQIINNIKWYYFNFEDGFGQNYYYITEKNTGVYLLEYTVEEDASRDCLTYKDQVLNSIKSLN